MQRPRSPAVLLALVLLAAMPSSAGSGSAAATATDGRDCRDPAGSASLLACRVDARYGLTLGGCGEDACILALDLDVVGVSAHASDLHLEVVLLTRGTDGFCPDPLALDPSSPAASACPRVCYQHAVGTAVACQGPVTKVVPLAKGACDAIWVDATLAAVAFTQGATATGAFTACRAADGTPSLFAWP